jgi:hypothetical protein
MVSEQTGIENTCISDTITSGESPPSGTRRLRRRFELAGGEDMIEQYGRWQLYYGDSPCGM